MLKEIPDCEDMLEVAGEYSGSCESIDSVHERSEKDQEDKNNFKSLNI